MIAGPRSRYAKLEMLIAAIGAFVVMLGALALAPNPAAHPPEGTR
jgi:hypothetical protein